MITPPWEPSPEDAAYLEAPLPIDIPPPRSPAPDWSEDQLSVLGALKTWLGTPHEPKKFAIIRETGPDRFDEDTGLVRTRSVQFRRLSPKTPTISLGGFGGTGKSTLIAHFSGEMLAQGITVAFATYTGKASLVLTQALAKAQVEPEYVGTIHRLIYQPDMAEDGSIRGWRKQDVIPYDLLIVDEASMVPSEILDDLLQYEVPMLVVGDHGQLPPVGQDAGVMAKPDLRLEVIHRQAAGNPIIAVSAAIRQGVPLRKIFEAVDDENARGDMRVRALRGRAALGDALKFTADPSKSMLITYTNATRLAMNAAARRARGFAPDTPPRKGESVICLRNNYTFEGGLLANGARGILEADAVPDGRGHYYAASVAFEDGRTLEVKMLAAQFGRLTFARYDEITKAGGPKIYTWDDAGLLCDYGYCLTCHKAQGSQAERVAVLFEGALGNMTPEESRRWCYTAATRSASELLLVTL